MSEGLVGLGHLVDVVTLLNSVTGAVHGIHDLGSQTLLHGLFTTRAGISSDPTQTQGLTALGTNIHGHLIVGAADTAGLDFQDGHDIFHGGLESLSGVFTGFLLNNIKSIVNDLLGNTLLTVQHNAVDELSYQLRIVNGIGQNVPLGYISSSGHFASLLHKMIS